MTDQQDPFELFRQTVEQFSAQSSSSTPESFAQLGMPMTPWPMTGGSGVSDGFTPEAGTKRAVRQLYHSIDQLSAGDLPTGSPGGMEQWQQAMESFWLGDQSMLPESPDQVGSMLLKTYLIWLYSLSQLLVESYTAKLVHDEIVVEEHENAPETQEWIWGLAQGDREELLRRGSHIEDELLDEMAATRVRREELAATLGSWEAVELSEPLADARRFMWVLRELDELATDGSGFEFLGEADEESSADESEDAAGADDVASDEDSD